MEADADNGTTIIVIKLPGSALFIHLCCTGCGARPRADGSSKNQSLQFKAFQNM